MVRRLRHQPRAKKAGGFRHARLDRTQIVQLSKLALENRKRSAEDIRAVAVERGLIPEDVSLSTIYRALRKTGLTHGRLEWKDPKTVTNPLIAAERRRFRAYQRYAEPHKLLFFDESNYRLWEQAKSGWKVKGEKGFLLRPKGTSPYVSVFVTIGAPDVLHYTIYRPKREHELLPSNFVASELARPGKGAKLPFTNRQIRGELTVAELRRILREHGVKHSGRKAELVERALHLKRHGKLGLPRPGRKDVGGKREPVINAAGDVLRYFHDELATAVDVQGRTVVMDNASTHGAPPLQNDRAVSFLHVRAKQDWGMDGVIFLPPRCPSLNPAELVFAWTKRLIRKEAPDEGYTEDELVAAIDKAFAKLREKVKQSLANGEPTFIDNWLRKCGYGGDGGRRRKRRQILANPNGTVGNGADAVDIYAGRHRRAARAARAEPVPHRWAGYGPGEPKDPIILQPELNVAELGGDVYEVEDIIDEEVVDGEKVYLVSWKGYEERTWVKANDIVAGREELKRRWRRR